MTALRHFDPAIFLRDYWQREPLLIRGAVADFQNPLSPEELAGLALDPEVESRLVSECDGRWQQQTGPFTEDSFRHEGSWTLLVQAVDQLVPAVGALRTLVDFLPGWRFDDVMVSFASDGGGVGPHYDHYDVFLLQGMGRRRWRLGQRCKGTEPLLPGDALRLLADFETSADYVLDAGDLLYVPPRLAHWGTAHGPCMTYSLGFRAPRVNDMVSRWIDAVLAKIEPELFYSDPHPLPTAAPGEISSACHAAALAQLQAVVAATPIDPDWFGELVTETQVDHPQSPPQGSRVTLAPDCRLGWRASQDTLIVYANGVVLHAGLATRPVLEKLCSGATVSFDSGDASQDLLYQLADNGCLQDE